MTAPAVPLEADDPRRRTPAWVCATCGGVTEDTEIARYHSLAGHVLVWRAYPELSHATACTPAKVRVT